MQRTHLENVCTALSTPFHYCYIILSFACISCYAINKEAFEKVYSSKY